MELQDVTPGQRVRLMGDYGDLPDGTLGTVMDQVGSAPLITVAFDTGRTRNLYARRVVPVSDDRYRAADIVMHDGEVTDVAEALGDGDVLLRDGRMVPESALSTPPLEVGDRVRLVDLSGTSHPTPPIGSTGEVIKVGEFVAVRWDDTSHGTTHGMCHWRYALTHRNTATEGSTMTTNDTTTTPDFKVGDVIYAAGSMATIRSIDSEEPRYLVQFEGGGSRWVNTDACTSRFKVGDRVTVHEGAQHGRATIPDDVSLPASGTLVAVDGYEPCYRVTIGEHGPRWMYSDMVEPAPGFAPGDKVTVNLHATRGDVSIRETFPFEATIQAQRVDIFNERSYQVLTEGSNWTVLESMLTKREEPTSEPTEEQREIAALEAQVSSLRTDLVRRDREMATLIEDAHTYADNNDLCSEFDRFMVDHGLPARERDYMVEATFTITAAITVRASDEEGAQERAEQEAESMLTDIDAAIERSVELSGVDTVFGEVGDATRQD